MNEHTQDIARSLERIEQSLRDFENDTVLQLQDAKAEANELKLWLRNQLEAMKRDILREVQRRR